MAARVVPAVRDAAAVSIFCRRIPTEREARNMFQITAKVDGMMCGMCEAHVKDAVRKAFPDAKKISASASDGRVEFQLENNLPIPMLKHDMKSELDKIGYKLEDLTSAEAEEAAKGGFFSKFRKK